MLLVAAALLAAPPLVTLARTAPTQDDELVFAIDHRGPAALLPDPRDAGLRALLEALPARLEAIDRDGRGVRGWIGEESPEDVPWMVARLVSGPGRASFLAPPQQDPAMRIFPTLTITLPAGDAAGAAAIDERMHGFLLELGAPEGAMEDGLHFTNEAPPAWWGPQGDDWVFHFGARREHPPLFDHGLPKSATRALALDLDLGALLAIDGLGDQLGLTGVPEDLVTGLHVRLDVGSTADEGFVTERFVGLAALLEAQGVRSPRPLDAFDLVSIPADATWAFASTLDLPALAIFVDLLLADLTYQTESLLDEFEQELGIDLVDDLLAHLGDVAGAFASDSTGGGGLLSTVLFAHVRDEAAFDATLDRLLAMLDDSLREDTRGYVRMRRWEQFGARFDSLVFGGLPWPLEVTLARARGHVLLAATPQAALAAVEQLVSARAGLPGREEFLRAFTPFREPRSVVWVDVPALIPRGYGLATMGASALANFSEADELVLPPLPELARGARPLVSVGVIEGRDLVSYTRHDRSWLATLTGLAGAVGSDSMLFGLLGVGSMATLALPMTLGRLEDARSAKARADLAALDHALTAYYVNNGSYPADLSALVTPDANGATYLNRRTLPEDPWGNVYRYDPPTAAKPYRLYTLGADNEPGGEDDARDLSHEDVRSGR